MLEKRDYACRELRDKLLQKGFSEADTEDWLLKLKEYGYIDDNRLITEQIKKRLVKQPISRAFLKEEMSHKGFDFVLILQGLEKLYPAADERKYAIQWLKKQKIRDEEDLIKKVAYLGRKGFDVELMEEIRNRWPILDSNTKKR